MEIKNLVIHKISKEKNKKSFVSFSDGETNISPKSTELITAIDNTYKTSVRKIYGEFESDTMNYPFQVLLNMNVNNSLSFFELTKKSMNLLKDKIDGKNFATGGYIIFVKYEDVLTENGSVEEFVMVVMVNDKHGCAINNFDVVEAIYVNWDKLHLACRINLSRRAQCLPKYLNFMKGKGTEVISKYFSDFIGCKEYSDPNADTVLLTDAITNFCISQGFTLTERINIRENIYSLCHERQKENRLVSLEEISGRINSLLSESDAVDSDAFFAYANSDEVGLSNTFSINPSKLKDLNIAKGKCSDYTLNFQFSALVNSAIRYENGKLIINYVPEDLRLQIERFQQGNELKNG